MESSQRSADVGSPVVVEEGDGAEVRRRWIYPLVFGPAAFLAVPLAFRFLVSADWPMDLWPPFRVLLVSFLLIPVIDFAVGSTTYARPQAPTRFRRLANAVFTIGIARNPFLLPLTLVTDAFIARDMKVHNVLGMSVAVGIYAAVTGILVAHEFMHRSSRLSWHTAEFLMTLTCYTHFCVEHVFGHHRRVATPEDPATARRGENVWSFVVRSVTGGFRSFLAIEAARRERQGIDRLSLRSRAVRYPLMIVAAAATMLAIGGPKALLFFVAQGAVAIVVLETINYVEHYGLERRRIDERRHERVSAAHSWDSGHIVSNLLLINIGRHADHHNESRRKYQDLRVRPAAPQLPFGYTTMLLVAWVPPLWRRLMDSRLDGYLASRPTMA